MTEKARTQALQRLDEELKCADLHFKTKNVTAEARLKYACKAADILYKILAAGKEKRE